MAKKTAMNEKGTPSITDDEVCEALRDRGAPEEKAARIANAQADGGTKDDRYDRAQEIGIEGRSDMTKDEPIAALRDH